MNDTKFRKRTDEESRARMAARREEKDRQKAQQRGRMLWPASQGTRNEGRNQAKRERRAMHFGQPWINPRAMVARPTKPVRPAANKRRRAMTAKRRAEAHK
jgi:hypothetical protein